VTTANPQQVRRLADCSLGLFSESVSLGETDMIVGPGELPKLYALNLPAVWVSALPNPEKWEQTHPSMQDDYQNQYLRYDAIIAQYETWRASYPGLISRTQIGTSAGGRAVWAYRLFAPSKMGARTAVRSVVINNGIHAREWISPAVGMFVLNTLINFLVNGPAQTGLPDATEYYFIPVMNVDGYEYCWTNNRMWRKNRRNNGNGTFGVDLNRNFSKGWGLNSGSSGSTSSETYRGPTAFSEPETSGFRDFLGTIKPVAAFVDFHSYGQYVLWPWGYQSTTAPGNSWLTTIGLMMKQSLFDAGGMNYTAGPTSTTLYLASGVSPDYVYDRFNSPAFTIELRDTGEFGFILPENQILPTQIEAWAAFKTLVQNMMLR